MERLTVRLTMVAVLLMAGLGAWAADGALPQPVENALGQLPKYTFGESREALTVVSDAVRDSAANKEQRAALEQRLCAILKMKEATLDAKQFVCRQLSIFAGDASVQTLAGMLAGKDTNDIARFALERMPGDGVDKALLAALGRTAGTTRVGVINSLGARACAAAVKPLAPLAAGSDKAAASAALSALGKIGTADALKAIDAAKKAAGADLHAVWADAALLCSDKLLAAGDAATAAKTYESLRADDLMPVRVAAFEGCVLAAGQNGVAVAVAGLTGGDPDVQKAATRFVRSMGVQDKAVTEAFAAAEPKLAPEGKVLLLASLGDRGNAAGLSAALSTIKHENADVRLAALQAVGKLGGASCVPELAQVAATAPKAEADAARASLDRLRGTDVDGAMAAHMKKCEAGPRAQLARSLAARNAVSAVPALLESAKDADETVRAESFKALGVLASDKALPELVALLISVEGSKARDETEKAVVSVAKGIADENKRAEAVLASLKKAKSVPAKVSMMNVLGQIGDSNGLKPLRSAAKGKKGEVKDAAVRALANWPKTDELDDLFKFIGKSKDETHRVLALRGAMRLLETAADKSADDKLKYYEKAFALAKNADEQKAVLGGIANAKDLRALNLVRPFAAVDGLKDEALLAMDKIKASQFKATASLNPDQAGRAIDGSMDTRWNTGAEQANGQWYQIDQAATYVVAKIKLMLQQNSNDFPRGYQVFVSDDANNWGAPVAEGASSGAVTEIACTPKAGRYVRIVQTANVPKTGWSITELTIQSTEPGQK